MTIRVPSFAYSERAVFYSSMHSRNILKYQEQISSGLRFQLPSEEPIAYRQVTSLRARYEELSADDNTINRATSILNNSVSQIQDLNTVFVSAKTLTQQGIQAVDEDERRALALEVDGLLNQLKNIAVAEFGGKYLYSGTKSGTPPFEFGTNTKPGEVLEVTYLGSHQRSRASVGDSITVDTYYSGLELFGPSGREDTVLVGETGAATGTGTDTVVGHAELLVQHGVTSYSGGSGIAVGSDSSNGDTILGALGAHTLTIEDTSGDGSSGTISLNGKEPVPFTSGDTNLAVPGSHGQVVYVDTTNITAGFSGTIDIESTGTLSIDGGVSTTAIDFSTGTNQVIVNAETGRSVTIDSTAIRQTGTDHLEFPGTADAFQLLHGLAMDLRNERGLSEDRLAEALDRRLGDLANMADNAFDVMGEQATALKTMENLGFRVQDLMLSVETQISEVQATDLPDAVVRLENAQALLQYNYAVTADLLQLGLINFLN